MASTTNPEQNPAPRPKRRTFSAEYKLRIVAEYDAAPNGEKGAILRRERLYHSHIIEWRGAAGAGGVGPLAGKGTPGRAPKKGPPQGRVGKVRQKGAPRGKGKGPQEDALGTLGKAEPP